MILYLRGPKDPTRKLLDIINTFSKAAGYKDISNLSEVYLNFVQYFMLFFIAYQILFTVKVWAAIWLF
jgi:hypothetical protein